MEIADLLVINMIFLLVVLVVVLIIFAVKPKRSRGKIKKNISLKKIKEEVNGEG